MTTIGFLHTSAVHVATFQALLAETAPDLDDLYVVDEALLNDARLHGVDVDLRARLQDRLWDLSGRGASVIVCTCSTLGGAAEELGDQIGAPVIRVDRPMAEQAAAIGGRIAIVAALASTLGPTRELLEEWVAGSARDAVLVESPCLDAWTLFESGDIDGYITHVVAHARALAAAADVIVLAQASMAAAADRLNDVEAAVLCSPSAAVVAAVELARDGAEARGAARSARRLGR